MIEIFKNPNFDFIGKSRLVISVSIILTIMGLLSFIVKGFNMGIDFAGGTLLNVRSSKPWDDVRLRQALASRGIDNSKVIIQPISSQLGQIANNEILIRMPQTTDKHAASGMAADKKIILAALTDSYSEIPAAARSNKIDVNNSSQKAIKARLLESEPTSSGPVFTTEMLEKFSAHIIDYRDNQRGGMINDISEIPLGGFPPQLSERLKANCYAGDFSIVNAEIVGPQAGQELRNRAIYVTLLALLGMLFFIAYRFEWIYGVAAVIAVFHDVIVTLACFSFFGWEISLNVIAALLTLIGYSMNDTIVIFDRIRERLRMNRRESLEKISNDAINETLSRTTITSGLTFLSVLALVLFGGPVLRGFSLALFIGIIIGTYSSIAIATPIMLWGRRFAAARNPVQE